MADRKRVGIEERKKLCTKRWEVKNRDNQVTSQCTGSQTWRKIENNEVDDKELLVAQNNKKCRKVCG